MIKLGSEVKDKVTGFIGIAISRVEYLNGCIQYGVKPKAKENKMPEVEYIDESQLKVLRTPEELNANGIGGIMPDAPR